MARGVGIAQPQGFTHRLEAHDWRWDARVLDRLAQGLSRDRPPALRGPKTRHVLDRVPNRIQAPVKAAVQEIGRSPTRRMAQTAFETCSQMYTAKYQQAVECIEKDVDDLLISSKRIRQQARSLNSQVAR